MSKQPRPQAVSLACVFIGITSGFLFFSLTGFLSDWGSIEMQEGLRPVATELQDAGVDVTLSGLLAVLRWLALAYVPVTIAGIVLSIYAMRRDRSARVGLTVVAGMLALALPGLGLIGALQAGIIVACAIALWRPEARAWYGGQASQPSTAEEPHAVDLPSSPVQARPARPRPVRTAGLLTVVGSSFVGGASALYVIVYALAGDALVTAGQDGLMASWVSPGEIEAAFRTSFWVCLALLPLTAAAIAAGVALLAGLRFGRPATLAVSWITVVAGVVMLPLGLIGSAAAVFVITLLNRAESRAWFQH